MSITISAADRRAISKKQIANKDALNNNTNASSYIDEQAVEARLEDRPVKNIYGQIEDEVTAIHGEIQYINGQERFELTENDIENAAFLRPGNYFFVNLDRYSSPSPIVTQQLYGQPYSTSARPYEESLLGDSNSNNLLLNLLVWGDTGLGTGDTETVKLTGSYSASTLLSTNREEVGDTGSSFTYGDTVVIYDNNGAVLGRVVYQHGYDAATHATQTANVSLASGYDWGAGNLTFKVTSYDAENIEKTVTLNSTTTTVEGVVAEINAEWANATPSAVVGMEAFASNNSIGLRTTEGGAGVWFSLAEGDGALATLGLRGDTSVGSGDNQDEQVIVAEYFPQYPDGSIGDSASISRFIPNFGDTQKQFYDTYPTAKAGFNQMFLLGDSGDSRILLSGDLSSDPNGDSLLQIWRMMQKPVNSRSDVFYVGDSVYFVPDAVGVYRIELWTHNHKKIVGDTMWIEAVEMSDSYPNSRITADVGTNLVAVIGDSVLLLGDSSFDPDGDSIAYLWSFDSVPSTSSLTDSDITNPTGDSAFFYPDEVGEYKIKLKVYDPFGDTDEKVMVAGVNTGDSYSGDTYEHSYEYILRMFTWYFGNWFTDYRESLHAQEYFVDFLNGDTGDTNTTALTNIQNALVDFSAEDYLGDSGLLKIELELANNRTFASLSSRTADLEMMAGEMSLTGSRSGAYSKRFTTAEIRIHKANGALAKVARLYETNELVDNLNSANTKNNDFYDGFLLSKKALEDGQNENYLVIDGDTGLSEGDAVWIISDGVDESGDTSDAVPQLPRVIDTFINVNIASGAELNAEGGVEVTYTPAIKMVLDKIVRDTYKAADGLRVVKELDSFTIPESSASIAETGSSIGEASTQSNLGLKVEVVTDPVSGNLPTLDSTGNIVDSGYEPYASVTDEPTGFPKTLTSLISFDNAYRKFSIAPPAGDSFYFYHDGIKYTKTTGDTVTIEDSEGLHYIYYVGDTLTTSNTVSVGDVFRDEATVSIVYWSQTDREAIYFSDERHGFIMDGATHSHLHSSVGSVYISGLALSNINSDESGDSFTDATLGVDDGVFHDQDIEFIIADGDSQEISPIAEIPIFYKLGPNGEWHKKAGDTFPLIYSGTAGYTGGRLPYNEWTGDSWVLTEVTNVSYVLYHYFATNDILEPVRAFIGENEYTTKKTARQGAADEIAAIVLAGLPVSEFVPIATVIFETSNGHSNTPQARILTNDEGGDYIDFRSASFISSSGSVTSHGALSGLADQDHPATAIITSVTNFDNALSAGDSNIQLALDTLDNIISSAISGDTGYIQYIGDTGANLSGDSRLFWDEVNGRLGIGTSSPASELHVSDTGGDVILTLESAGGSAPQLKFYQAETLRGIIYANANGIITDNNVGIGTSSPQSELHIKNVGGDVILTLESAGGSAPQIKFYQAANLRGVIYANANGIITDYNIGIGTTSPQSELHIKNEAEDEDVTLTLESTAGRAPQIKFYQAGTLRGTIHANSYGIITDDNIGIGTTSPASELHVRNTGGDVILTLESAGGSAPQIKFYQAANLRGVIYANANGIIFTNDVLPSGHKTLDCGAAAIAWDDVYAYDFDAVADLFWIDERDDIGVICNIKPSGEADERTGLPLIDDDSVPDWVWTKNKKTLEIARDPDGKPFLGAKMTTSLTWGAIRQMMLRINELETQVKNLNTETGNFTYTPTGNITLSGTEIISKEKE